MKIEHESELLEILDRAADLTLTTMADDGYPKASTIGFVHDGLAIYCSFDATSPIAENLARDTRVLITFNLPYVSWNEIHGISLGGQAIEVASDAELSQVMELMAAKLPHSLQLITGSDRVGTLLYRVMPEVISLIDCRKGFGHTETIWCQSTEPPRYLSRRVS